MWRVITVITVLLVGGCTANPNEALFEAAASGDVGGLEKAIAQGGDVNSVNSEGQDLLTISSLRDKPEAVRFLLAHEAKIKDNDTRLSAPELAASMGHDAILEAFFEAGFPPTWTSKDGKTLLHAAAEGNESTVKLLLKNGVPVDGPPGVDTPLYIAVGTNHLPIVKALLAAGANPNYRDTYGNCPLTMAIAENRKDIARELAAFGAKECR
jgi:ankyrin repeat protein